MKPVSWGDENHPPPAHHGSPSITSPRPRSLPSLRPSSAPNEVTGRATPGPRTPGRGQSSAAVTQCASHERYQKCRHTKCAARTFQTGKRTASLGSLRQPVRPLLLARSRAHRLQRGLGRRSLSISPSLRLSVSPSVRRVPRLSSTLSLERNPMHVAPMATTACDLSPSNQPVTALLSARPGWARALPEGRDRRHDSVGVIRHGHAHCVAHPHSHGAARGGGKVEGHPVVQQPFFVVVRRRRRA